MTNRIPVDSADARELAEQRQLDDHDQRLRQLEHDRACRDGWLGEDTHGRPIPCLVCRPHLATTPCHTCGVIAALCDRQVDRGRGRCCTRCQHDRTTR